MKSTASLLIVLFLTTCSLLQVKPHRAHAQTDETAQATPPAKPKDRYLELLLWELDLAEGGYRIHRNDETFSRLLTAQEKLIYKTCFPRLTKTLEPPGKATDPLCLERIAETLALDSRNAAAICARDGLFSDTCASRYAAIEQKKMNRKNSSSQTELEAQLAKKKNLVEIAKLRSRLYGLEKRIEQQKNSKLEAEQLARLDESMLEYREIADKLLSLECAVEEYGVTMETAVRAVSTPSPLGVTRPPEMAQQPLSIREELKRQRIALGVTKEEDVGVESGGPEQPIPSDKIVRVRYITPECGTLIPQILEVVPNYAPALCRQVGLYSPDCIRGLQILRRHKFLRQRAEEKGTTPEEENKREFETF